MLCVLSVDGGVRAFSFLCEWVTAHGVYENRE